MWLPAIFRKKANWKDLPGVTSNVMPTILEARKLEVAEKQANALNAISEFLTGDGLPRVLGAVARSNTAAALLQGLTAHDGRAGLDSRTQNQNAIEICYLVQKVFDKFQEKLQAQQQPTDDELKDGEESCGYTEWLEKQRKAKHG